MSRKSQIARPSVEEIEAELKRMKAARRSRRIALLAMLVLIIAALAALYFSDPFNWF
jgi:cell division septal protein FtsQ